VLLNLLPLVHHRHRHLRLTHWQVWLKRLAQPKWDIRLLWPFARVGASRCHCLPGDACWPASSQWSALNTTVNGGLVATVPIGTPCHDPNYDEVACAALQSNWTLPQLQCAPRPANSIVFRYVPDWRHALVWPHRLLWCKHTSPTKAATPSLLSRRHASSVTTLATRWTYRARATLLRPYHLHRRTTFVSLSATQAMSITPFSPLPLYVS
jgi:hypothetical protein